MKWFKTEHYIILTLVDYNVLDFGNNAIFVHKYTKNYFNTKYYFFEYNEKLTKFERLLYYDCVDVANKVAREINDTIL